MQKKINGSTLFLTQSGESAYRVSEGSVMVFIVPVTWDGLGRRCYLCSLQAGQVVPGLSQPGDVELGEDCIWTFGLLADGEAVIEEIPLTEELTKEFYRISEMRDWGAGSFGENAAETYRMENLRFRRNLHVMEGERQNVAKRSLEAIEAVLSQRVGQKSRQHEVTENPLYDAVAAICETQRIPVADYDKVRAACGPNFTARDIARISGFCCREIVLNAGWQHTDCGPVLAYTTAGKKPVVCLQKGARNHVVYDPAARTRTKIDDELAQNLHPRAMVFYRPFPSKKLTWKDLVRYALEELNVADLLWLAVLSLIGVLIGLLMPYLNELVFDLFIPLGDINGMNGICFVVLACSLGNICFSITKNLTNFRALNRMKYAVEAATIDRLFNLPESFYRGFDSADLGSRAAALPDMFTTLASTAISVWLTSLFSLTYLWRMVKYSGKLSLYAGGMLLVGMIVITLLGWFKLKYERELGELGGRLSSLLFQFINGITKLRMTGVENRANYEYISLYSKVTSISKKSAVFDRATGLFQGVLNVAFSVVMYYTMIHGGLKLSIGAFMGFNSAFGSFSSSMLNLVSSFLTVNSVRPTFERVRPVLETLPEQQEDAALPGELDGSINVDNVTFAYAEDAPTVLNEFSLSIKPGEYLGVVGASGCGKSTLLKLLLGFETPQLGRIYYSGMDIATLNKRELRKKVGVVLQDGGLITGSIYDNIVITNPRATMADVERAVQRAGLERDIKLMPMGLHTILSEGDGMISGGQKQRILIARAIVGEPKILFFDEATSALDNETQAAVCDSLEQLHATRVVIAHRLSTIIRCDRIIVLDKGHIVEQGTFDELMAQKGLFYEMASRQMM